MAIECRDRVVQLARPRTTGRADLRENPRVPCPPTVAIKPYKVEREGSSAPKM